jgi:hypothetical protein
MRPCQYVWKIAILLLLLLLLLFIIIIIIITNTTIIALERKLANELEPVYR